MKTRNSRLNELQREVADALLRDRDTDEALAERHDATLDAIRIERSLARRRLAESVYKRRFGT